MDWSHLPYAGGLFDQDPMLLEEFRYIFTEQGKHEAEKRKADEVRSKQAQRGSQGGVRPKGSRTRGRS